jgi:translation initiation factor 2B subunit (eIF-2B alpha/beta/delta family)
MLAVDVIKLGSQRFSKQVFGNLERDALILVNMMDYYISDNNQDEAANVLELLKAVSLTLIQNHPSEISIPNLEFQILCMN